MFTGLIQAIGTLEVQSEEQLFINCSQSRSSAILQDLAIGDSVAVDGVCLTAAEILPHGFVAAISPETLQRTTLQSRSQQWVNLETSLRVGGKVGGHFVSGHVDGLGILQTVVQTRNAWELSFEAPPTISRYIVFKGSIAINGISLTVAACSDRGDWFRVAVIPHTYQETNLKFLQPGDRVNLEGDLLGKYVEKFLRLDQGRSALNSSLDTDGDASKIQDCPKDSPYSLTPAFLAEHGYGV